MFKTLYKSMTVSHSALDSTNYMLEHITAKMADSLATDIIKCELKEKKHLYHKEYEIKLIVATPEDFHKAVAEHARNMYGYPMIME